MLIKFYNNGSNGKLVCLSPAYYLQSLKVYTAWCRYQRITIYPLW